MRHISSRLSSLPLPTLLAAMVLMSPLRQPLADRAAPTTIVTGRVLDPGGQPIAAATLSIPARSLSTTSRADGRYALAVPRNGPSETVSLQATKSGFGTRRLGVYLNGDTVRADITMTPSAERPVAMEPVYPTAAGASNERGPALKAARHSFLGTSERHILI